MTFNTLRSVTLIMMMLLLTSLPSTSTAFGARRQYHSYHHLSQQTSSKKKNIKHGGNKRDHSPLSSLAGNPQEQTEMLLERAARIRALSAQIREVELATIGSSQSSSASVNERRQQNIISAHAVERNMGVFGS